MQFTDLNQLTRAEFLAALGGSLEGQQWLAEKVSDHRPFADSAALLTAFETVLAALSETEKIWLIRSHPDLGTKARQALSAASVQEQAAAGLNHLSADEFEEFTRLNAAYKARFDFPFVICARENTKHSILAAFRTRLENSREQEITTGVGEVLKIIRLRLLDLLADSA